MFSRVDRVRKALIKEVSDIIQRHVKDPRISGIVSVTDVDVSSDYSYAKVYISVYGSEEQKEQTKAFQSEVIIFQLLITTFLILKPVH